jgi:hypothetical protein
MVSKLEPTPSAQNKARHGYPAPGNNYAENVTRRFNPESIRDWKAAFRSKMEFFSIARQPEPLQSFREGMRGRCVL